MNAARLSRRSKSRGAPVGRLAFTGFWMLVGSAGPLALTNASDTPRRDRRIAVLAVGLGLFFLSLRRLNRQMIAVKQREVGLARDLYMQACEKVRDRANTGGVAGPGQVGQRRRGTGQAGLPAGVPPRPLNVRSAGAQ